MKKYRNRLLMKGISLILIGIMVFPILFESTIEVQASSNPTLSESEATLYIKDTLLKYTSKFIPGISRKIGNPPGAAIKE